MSSCCAYASADVANDVTLWFGHKGELLPNRYYHYNFHLISVFPSELLGSSSSFCSGKEPPRSNGMGEVYKLDVLHANKPSVSKH